MDDLLRDHEIICKLVEIVIVTNLQLQELYMDLLILLYLNQANE
jgi:hypothetical protein